jgi:DNA ligase-1
MACTLAHPYDVKRVRKNGGLTSGRYFVSEKLDGIRAIWDGRSLKTRNGNLICVSTSITDGLPKHNKLDGELWIGRGTENFGFVNGAFHTKNDQDPRWVHVKYMVFDIFGSQRTYEHRYNQLKSMKFGDQVKVVEQRTDTKN